MSKVRWGVLSTAKIGTEKVIPAMQRGERSEVVAIASRDAERARSTAAQLGIATAHGSYEALIEDPAVDAIYNALPNHLHVEWSIRAAERGKHVLCEKPLGLTPADAERLIAVRDSTGVKMQEAFMVWTHPQWTLAREIIASGRLGDVRAYVGCFSYFNDDPSNIRNVRAYGGGGLYDIGCYLIVTSRFVYGDEPRRVAALMTRDEASGTDTLTSLMLDYAGGHAVGTCSTRLVPYQRVQIFGTRGRLEIEIPFNAPPDRPCRLFVDDGRDVFGSGVEIVEIPTADQYTIQGDLFSRAIQEDGPVAYPLERTLQNMRIIEAAFRSAETGTWVETSAASPRAR
jgi:predicted dehydrogenase